MYVRGIRGATTVERNEAQEIHAATSELLHAIIDLNHIRPEDICSVFVTVTQDLDATFPARVIREMSGWELVPLMCSVEIAVQNSLAKCIRLMVLINTEKEQQEMVHVYQNGAKVLRPDLTNA